MSSNFVNNNRDHKFIFKEWLKMDDLLNTPRFKGIYDVSDLDFILDNALKAAREVIAPTCEDSDTIGVRYDNGCVITPASTKGAYFFIQQNGLASSNANPDDEASVPLCVLWAINEYLVGANPSISTLYLATTGAAGLIEEFASPDLKQTYLDRMYSGEWAGTMDLTEPSAGSDVGDIVTRAVPTGQAGVYRIKGTKCFISGGEQDITENIVHMVLARIEGAASGTRGLSLFIVPKYLPAEDGSLASFNDVNCVGIEHKLGLKGSPTCVIAFGEEDNCLGFLLGEAPGEDGSGQGMAQMFNMMNEERLMTGHAGMSLAAVAYHNSVQYASERIQGRAAANPKAGRTAIVNHEDIRRMLLFQKAHIEAFRAMVLKSFYLVDMRKHCADQVIAKQAAARVEINTPIVKAYCSDLALQCISESLQIHGGYGFSEEYSPAELYRDARIYPIWEGTNYIQSMDLVGRKMSMAKGQVFAAWLSEIEGFIANHRSSPVLGQDIAILDETLKTYMQIQQHLKGFDPSTAPGMLQLYATRILHATGKLYAAYLLLDMAVIAARQLEGLEQDHYDYGFYAGKIASAQFFARNILPEIGCLEHVLRNADRTAIDMIESSFV